MHRVIGAALGGKDHVKAFIGELKEQKHTPGCEPDIIYDLLRAHIRAPPLIEKVLLSL